MEWHLFLEDRGTRNREPKKWFKKINKQKNTTVYKCMHIFSLHMQVVDSISNSNLYFSQFGNILLLKDPLLYYPFLIPAAVHGCWCWTAKQGAKERQLGFCFVFQAWCINRMEVYSRCISWKMALYFLALRLWLTSLKRFVTGSMIAV